MTEPMGHMAPSENPRARVTLHSHSELGVLAAGVDSHVHDERFTPGVDELRAALGVGDQQRLECWLLVDRSGSVLFDRDEGQQVTLAWHFASFDSDRDRIGILGFSGFGAYINLFEFKTPLGRGDQALQLVADCGGGGTPTAEAVTYAARMLSSSAAEVKLVIVVTNAPANDTARCARAVDAARSRGMRVIGVLKPESRHEHPDADHSAFMTEQFGTDWFQVDSYTEIPKALTHHLATATGPGSNRTPAHLAAAEPRVPAEYDRVMAAAADALLALGDEAAREFSERTLDALNPELRTLAHYVRMRLEYLHIHGDEAFAAARQAALER